MTLPRHIQKELADALEGIGLSDAEIEVLSVLLQSTEGQLVSGLAKKARLNRTTLYGILKSLAQKGFVSSIEEGGVLKYQAIQPHLLVDYIERARNKMSADIERIKKVLPVIEAQREKGSRAYPTVQFFEGIEGIKQAYEDTIKHNRSKMLYDFLGTDSILKLMESDWLDYYITTRVKMGIRAFTISADTPVSRHFKNLDPNQMRTLKLLPPGYDFENELVAYDDKVLLTSFAEDHPFSILIEDQKIAQLIVAIFRYTNSTLAE